ncbi:hypothetical protein [Phreatobacter oligotrophus]|uniref:Uncharacterized protein n=1 Tax=Phreatobacter oligotrophus TaxID=1122261 RepID=A0A2T4Z693_9HYPH|nr:hypothetical protein [Phreatobacter oligotrophus]PTM57393.1 hypothetical protein C8P69_104447 [Phreatobacter oligotrophus]
MDRVLGLVTIEQDMAKLMRAAERAGLALGCIDPEETSLVLPGDETDSAWTLGRIGAWAVTMALAGAFLIL